MNRKNRLFIWSHIKIAVGFCFLFIKYDLWKNNVDFGFWDWTAIVIIFVQVIKAIIDIDSVTSKASG